MVTKYKKSWIMLMNDITLIVDSKECNVLSYFIAHT